MSRHPLGDRKYRTWKSGILRRDGWRCVICGAQGPAAQVEVDHIVPRVAGGPLMAPGNARVLCADCNRTKGGRAMSDDEVRRRRHLPPVSKPHGPGLGPILRRGYPKEAKK